MLENLNSQTDIQRSKLQRPKIDKIDYICDNKLNDNLNALYIFFPNKKRR